MQVDQRLVLIALLVNFGCCSQAGEIIEERHHRTKRQLIRRPQVNNHGNDPGINHGGYVGSFPIDQQGPYTAIGNQQDVIPSNNNDRRLILEDQLHNLERLINSFSGAQLTEIGNILGIGHRGSIGTLAGDQQGPFAAIGNQQRSIPHNNNQQGLFTDHRPASYPDAHVNNYGNHPGISQGGSAKLTKIGSTTRSSQRFTTVASTTQRPYVLFNSPECGVNSLPNTRIVGGNDTKVNEYPWAASLIRKNTGLHFCGGSLITERYVLTAAHCLTKFDDRQITIRLGEHSFDQENESKHDDFSILSSNVHEQYNEANSMNDIAVVKLDRTVSFSKSIALICLPTGADLFTDEEATAIGWGRLQHRGPVSKVLQEVSVPVWSNSKCEAVFTGRNYTIFDGSICAGDKKEEGSITAEGRDSCQGDIGGPLMIQMGTGFNLKWHVIGVTSHGFNCGELGIPGIYTRVSKYFDWIASHTI